MQLSNLCISLITKGLAYGPSYGSGFSNHTPMSLVALDCMGASEKQLNNYFEHSIQRLVRRPVEENFEDLYDQILGKIEKQGPDLVLQEELPDLMNGVAGAAFHPMIRLSYGLLSGIKEELASALAYWSCESLILEQSSGRTQEPIDVLLENLTSKKWNRDHSPNITGRILQIASQLNGSGDAIIPVDLKLDQIRRVCMSGFTQHNNFTILHTLTASHAYRVLGSKLDHHVDMLERFWLAIALAYLSTGKSFEAAQNSSFNEEMSWDMIKEKACESLDDHVIKLVFSCQQEFEFYGNPEYQFIAQRAISS